MNIKATKESSLTKLILGTEKQGLKPWILGTTLGFWSAGTLIALAVYSLSNKSIFYDELMIYVSVSATIAIVFTLISFIFSSDWDIDDGSKIWARTLLYNVIMLFGVLYTYNHIEAIKVIEPVKRMVFKTSYASDCPHTIHLHTENVHQTLCDNGEKTKRFQSEKLEMNIIATYRYGKLIDGELEILENEIIIASNDPD